MYGDWNVCMYFVVGTKNLFICHTNFPTTLGYIHWDINCTSVVVASEEEKHLPLFDSNNNPAHLKQKKYR